MSQHTPEAIVGAQTPGEQAHRQFSRGHYDHGRAVLYKFGFAKDAIDRLFFEHALNCVVVCLQILSSRRLPIPQFISAALEAARQRVDDGTSTLDAYRDLKRAAGGLAPNNAMSRIADLALIAVALPGDGPRQSASQRALSATIGAARFLAEFDSQQLVAENGGPFTNEKACYLFARQRLHLEMTSLAVTRLESAVAAQAARVAETRDEFDWLPTLDTMEDLEALLRLA